jgi:hypothetical protein
MATVAGRQTCCPPPSFRDAIEANIRWWLDKKKWDRRDREIERARRLL